MSQLFTSGGQNIGVSASASVLPMNSGMISFMMDWLDLLAVQRTLKSLLQPSPTVQKHQFFCAQLSLESNSHPYMTTGRTIALTRQTFVGKIMSLLFNMLFRLVKASLTAQRLKRLPPMRETWVQSRGWEDPLEKGIHFSILAWRVPWTI